MGSEGGFLFFPDWEFINTDDHRSSHLVIINAFIYLVIVKVSHDTQSAWNLTWHAGYFVTGDCAFHLCTLRPGVGSGILQAYSQHLWAEL